MKDRNIQRLTLYMVSMSAAICVPSSLLIMDMLLLRMRFDIRLFGVIKSSMFLLPAIVYWLLADSLRNLRIAPAVCRWAYLLRITLPIAIPLAGLFVDSAALRMAICIAVMSVSFSLAMIANNTLVTVSRAAVDEGSFNRYSAFFTVLQGAPGSLLAYPIAKFLGNASLNDVQFLRLYIVLELVVGLFYIPAFVCMRDLSLKKSAPPPKASFSDYLMPLKDMSCMPLFLMTFVRMFWQGMLASYWCVYLMKMRGWTPQNIVVIEACMMIALIFIAPMFGKLADRRGLRVCFFCTTLISFAAAGLNLLFWTSATVLAIVILVNHNGSGGLVACSSLSLLSSSTVVSAPKGHSERYLAASSFFSSIGAFAGCCFASKVFSWLANGAEPTDATFHLYFSVVTLLLIPLLALSAMLKRR